MDESPKAMLERVPIDVWLLIVKELKGFTRPLCLTCKRLNQVAAAWRKSGGRFGRILTSVATEDKELQVIRMRFHTEWICSWTETQYLLRFDSPTLLKWACESLKLKIDGAVRDGAIKVDAAKCVSYIANSHGITSDLCSFEYKDLALAVCSGAVRVFKWILLNRTDLFNRLKYHGELLRLAQERIPGEQVASAFYYQPPPDPHEGCREIAEILKEFRPPCDITRILLRFTKP